jgi:hypothetical protein
VYITLSRDEMAVPREFLYRPRCAPSIAKCEQDRVAQDVTHGFEPDGSYRLQGEAMNEPLRQRSSVVVTHIPSVPQVPMLLKVRRQSGSQRGVA